MVDVGRTRRFFFALFALLRYEVNLGFLERPLSVGFVWGAITGEWQMALSLAVFHELLWLDLFPAGTYIPPNGVLSLLLCLVVAGRFNLSSPDLLAVPLLLVLPAALCGAQLEYLLRKRENRQYNAILHWGRQPAMDQTLPSGIVRSSLLWHGLAQFCMFVAWSLVLDVTIRVFAAAFGYIPRVNGVLWGHLWFVAGLGGLLALRIRRAYVVFGFSLAAGVATLVLI